MATASKKARPKKAKRATNSPLLRSALEVLEHGLWHFFRSDTTADMKFAIVHTDQAVELLLKERVRSGGQSIYKSPKETITIWGAYKILEELGCEIPERPNLEMLHEERNSIQHKFSNPSPEDAAFHIDNAVTFIARFLEEELSVDITEHIPAEHLDQLLPPPTKAAPATRTRRTSKSAKSMSGKAKEP